MAIPNMAAYRARQSAPSETIRVIKTYNVTAFGACSSLWTQGPAAGAAPTTPVVPNNDTPGAVGQRNGGAAALRLVEALISTSGQVSACAMLIDRLSHQAGLSGTAAGAQTTNLPTAALTRYTSGDDVMIGLEIYTTIGATATTVTVEYTNEAGVGGRVTPLVVIGATGNREGTRFLQLPLQQGDKGVRSVESVTLTATTGAVGNFGVTLYKTLMNFPQRVTDDLVDVDPLLTCGVIPEIVDDSCLSFLFRPLSFVTGQFITELRFAED